MNGRHYGAVLAANARPGPGRGPAPASRPDAWWWRRWAMYDALLWDTIDGLDPEAAVAVLQRWPDQWPSPESGGLSIRRMEWARVHMIAGQEFDARTRMMTDPPGDQP